MAQLYLHQEVASVTQPVMQLKAFQRITLQPGERRTVDFMVTPQMLSILDVRMERTVEPGTFNLMIGSNSDNTSAADLTVTTPSRMNKSTNRHSAKRN